MAVLLSLVLLDENNFPAWCLKLKKSNKDSRLQVAKNVATKVLKTQTFFFVPIFDTKVTENLCSGWGFYFLQTNFDFLTSHF